jgi:hypothetical protein
MEKFADNIPEEDLSALVELVEEGEITSEELVQQLQRADLGDLSAEDVYERVSRWLERQDLAENVHESVGSDEPVEAQPAPQIETDVRSGEAPRAVTSRATSDALLVSLLQKVRQRQRFYASQAERVGAELKRLRRLLLDELRPGLEAIHSEALDRLTELAGDIGELRSIRDELLQRREERLREQLASASAMANTLENELTEALKEDDGERAANCMLRIEALSQEIEETLGLSPGQIAKARRMALERYRTWVYKRCGAYLNRLGPWPSNPDAAFLRRLEASEIAARIRALAQQSVRVFRGPDAAGFYGGTLNEEDDRRSATSEYSGSTAHRASGRDRRYFEHCFLQTQVAAFEKAFREAIRAPPVQASSESKLSVERGAQKVSSQVSETTPSRAVIDFAVHYLKEFAERYRPLLRVVFDGMDEDVDLLVESMVHEFMATIAEVVFAELENRYSFGEAEEDNARPASGISHLYAHTLQLVDALVTFDRDMALIIVSENHSLMHSWMEAEFQSALNRFETALRTPGALGIVIPGTAASSDQLDLLTKGRAILDSFAGHQNRATTAAALQLDALQQASLIGETLHSLATRCRALPPHPHRARYRFAQSVIAPLIGWIMAQIHYLMTETEAQCATSLQASMHASGAPSAERFKDCYLLSADALYRTLSYAAAAYLLAEDIRQRVEIYLYELEFSNAPDQGPDSELESENEQSARSDVVGAGNPYDAITAEVTALRKLSSKALASYADTVTDMLAPCFLEADADASLATPALVAAAMSTIQDLVALSELLLRGHRTLLLWLWAPFFLQLDAKLAMFIAQWRQQLQEANEASQPLHSARAHHESEARSMQQGFGASKHTALPIQAGTVQQLADFAAAHFQLRHTPLHQTRLALEHMLQFSASE